MVKDVISVRASEHDKDLLPTFEGHLVEGVRVEVVFSQAQAHMFNTEMKVLSSV